MSPAMVLQNMESLENRHFQKGVKHMYENGVDRVPLKYVLPAAERPNAITQLSTLDLHDLPLIDLGELLGPNRAQALESLSYACQNYGFFQLVNHGISNEIIEQMVSVSRRFFDLPLAEREMYMSADMSSPVRYGTSFNQTNDGVFCWRDFLKLICNPISDVLPHWPLQFRECGVLYAEETKKVFMMVVEAILESLGLKKTEEIVKELEEDGSQLMVVNCYPPCPQPDLTLGMPPHSDYGFLTLLLQDHVQGLQILHQDQWVSVRPVPGSFVVNVGDHLEIFSNGRYKSVLHRVVVNTMKHRISVASLHSLPFTSTVRPAEKLITETNPRSYKDTDFASFLEHIKSCDSTKKSFLESRKLLS